MCFAVNLITVDLIFGPTSIVLIYKLIFIIINLIIILDFNRCEDSFALFIEIHVSNENCKIYI